MKVYIVEDDLSQREMLEIILEQHGFEIKSSIGNEKDIIRSMEDFKPNVILLDLILPDSDGYDLCNQIIRNQELSSTPVVVLSCIRDIDTKMSLLSSGCLDFLTKPYKTENLINKLKTYCKIGSLNNKLRSLSQKTGI